jgi:hypothetical protein
LKNLFIPFFVLFTLGLTAQVERIIHQSFDVSKKETIKLTLEGEYDLEPWASNNLLVESTVTISPMAKETFNYLVEEGRYALVEEGAENASSLVPKIQNRKKITYKGNFCDETVKVVVRFPDDFKIIDSNTLERRKEE